MKKQKGRMFTLELVDLLDEAQCRKFLFDLVKGPVCRYCRKSVPDRHLKRFYEGKEVYCHFCDKKMFATGGTIISQTKLTYKQILKILVMLNLDFRTSAIAKAADVDTHAVPRWRKKLYAFENE